MSSDFVAFPSQGFDFLRELGQNNNKSWFEAHRDEFRDFVQEPARAILEAVGSALEASYAPISYDPRPNGGSMMRIYRDTRFSADKRPYKEAIAMMFVPPHRKRMEAPGFGLQITNSVAELVAGQFAFTPEQLTKYREMVVDSNAGEALEVAVAQVQSAGPYSIGEPSLKRVPRGFDAEHPRADWLRYKGMTVFSPPIARAIAESDTFVPTVLTHFAAMAPVWEWLNSYLG